MSDAIEEVRALAAVREGLGDRVASALARVQAAASALASASSAVKLASEEYDGDAKSEPARLKVRALAASVVTPHAELAEAIENLRVVSGDARRSDEAVSKASRRLLDPEKVRIASAAFALAALPVEVAKKWATGDVGSFAELRAFIDATQESASASAFLRCEGSAAHAECAPALFYLGFLEQLAELGKTPMHVRFLDCTFFPAPLSVGSLRAWIEKKSDISASPQHVENVRGMLASVRRAAERGARTAAEIQDFQDGENPRRNLHQPARAEKATDVDANGDWVDAPIVSNMTRMPATVSSSEPNDPKQVSILDQPLPPHLQRQAERDIAEGKPVSVKVPTTPSYLPRR